MNLFNLIFESLSPNFQLLDIENSSQDDFEIELPNGEEVLSSELQEQLEIIFKNSGVRIMSVENPYEVIIDKNGTVLGGSVISYDVPSDEDYDDGINKITFSIAVDDTARGKGIAAKLVQSLISKKKRRRTILRAQVINPIMEKVLIKFGFQKVSESDSVNGLVYEL